MIALDIEALVEAIAEQPDHVKERLAVILRPFIAPTTPAPTGRRGPFGTIPEVAEYMACARQRVDTLLSRGRLTRVKDGGRTLIRWDEVDAYLANGATGPVGEALSARSRFHQEFTGSGKNA